MAATNLKIRSDRWSSFEFTSATDYTAGDMDIIEDTVGVVVETTTSGDPAVLIYSCEKIVVPKTAGTGITFSIGDKVYYDDTAQEVTNVSTGNTLCGRATLAATATDTTAEIDLKGNVEA